MTDGGTYNAQNKAHRRILGDDRNKTQRNCHMQSTLQEIEKVNNKNRNQNCNPIKSEPVKAVLLKTHFLRYVGTLAKLLQTS
jgi:cytidylate kinase